MLRHLRIQNFKAWKDTGNIELAPITVFLGTNSSGKSSIAQFLMMLKQTVEHNDPNEVLFTGDENSAVDVGTPFQMLYGHDTTQSLQFSYDWDVDTPFTASFESRFDDSLKGRLTRGKDCFFIGTRIFFNNAIKIREFAGAMEVEKIRYHVIHENVPIFSLSMEKENETDIYYVSMRGFDKTTTAEIDTQSDLSVTPLKFYGFHEETIARYPQIPAMRTLNVQHPKLFASMFYLGPLRVRTDRLYIWRGNDLSDVGIDGSNAIFAMLSANAQWRAYELFDLKKNQYRKLNIGAVIAEMLEKMGLISEFQVSPIQRGRAEYEVKVKTKGSPVWTDLPDVGFGISQVLPVIVELFYVPAGSIILMEQPELHLHPSAQAALADVMIDAIKARENGQDRNIQLLIETHSEHFLRRLQRRIAEGVIDEKTVRGYFADTSETPFQLRPLEIDTYGNILNWPENFFGDIGNDIYLQADAALERKINGMRKKSENH